MKIAGFIKTSMIDYPDTLSSVIFTKACNFNCGFCHNGDLLDHDLSLINPEVILDHLDKRKGIIDGLVITGGEPTLQLNLLPFIRKVKAKGLKVKLDTNGYQPEVINKLLDDGLIDYIAMDIKSDLSNYHHITGISLDINQIKKSIKLIKNSEIDYEFRTTVMKKYHSCDSFEEIGRLLGDVKRFTLQQYTYADKQVEDEDYGFYTINEMEAFIPLLKKGGIKDVLIKGRY